ncbi:MAG: ABC transporter substrate-binding protein [Acidobacteriota bacterium]
MRTGRLRHGFSVVLCAGVALAAGCAPEPAGPDLRAADLAATPWETIRAHARGTTVHVGMWAGDEARNRFFQGPVTEAVAAELGVTLRITPLADVADLVSKLLNERRAGRRSGGSIDVVWINGENFRTARQAGVLWGPFADHLPNIVHYPDAAKHRDFGTDIDGFEAPWEVAQFVFAYDTARITDPPRTLGALRQWIERHPGRFTYPAVPDFTGSAFLRHVLVHASGLDPEAFLHFDEARYAAASARALDFLAAIRPHLWRGGETYPATPADLNRLFVNHEIDFSMNYSPSFASDRIARGEFPETVRTFVLEEGTLSNYSYLAVPFNASNPAGALAVIDHLLSPAHALARVRAIGGLFPQSVESLTPGDRQAVALLPRGPATLAAETLARHRIPEPDAEYLVRFERDWLREVLQQ